MTHRYAGMNGLFVDRSEEKRLVDFPQSETKFSIICFVDLSKYTIQRVISWTNKKKKSWIQFSFMFSSTGDS